MSMRTSSLVFLAALVVTACKPDLGAPQSLVDGLRVLSVRGTPAESAASRTVALEVLAVTPEGSLQAPTVEWAPCVTSKTPSDPGPISPACLANGVTLLTATGPSARTLLPSKVCQLFGPDLPPRKSGEPVSRPRDPDVTGGYYMPVRVTVTDASAPEPAAAFGFERILCNLGNASADVARDFRARYVVNDNPVLAEVAASIDGAAPVTLQPLVGGALPADALHAPRGATLSLTASWPADSAETYVQYDLTTQTLVERREALRVSWFTTAGELAHDRSGRAEDDAATTTDNELMLPAVAGPVHLWLVLRDSRGGQDWLELGLVVD
jgi:hypothetical protein